MESLKQRVERLERDNRRLRRALWTGATMLGLVFMLGQARPKPEVQAQEGDKPVTGPKAEGAAKDEIITRALSIVDEKGRKRIECTVSENRPVMHFFDEGGTPRVRVQGNSVWPTVEIVNESGATRLSIGSSPKGPGILFQAPDKRPRAVLGATDDGPGLVLFDGQRPRILVGVKNNQPVMAVLNNDSKLSFDTPQPAPETQPPSDKPADLPKIDLTPPGPLP